MWQRRWSVIVDRIRLVHSGREESDLMTILRDRAGPRVLGFVNAHALNSSAEDAGFFDALVNADILLRDGSGMAILYRMLQRDPGLNMNGTDFIPKVLAAFRGRRVALWGTTEPYLSHASVCCVRDYGVRIVSTLDGFRDPACYIDQAKATRPDLIILGMGMPRQERLARQLVAACRDGPLIVCGGAVIDFLGGKVRRAPPWVRRLGLEWVYRLAREPVRLYRRYVVGNPVFLAKLLLWCATPRLRK